MIDLVALERLGRTVPPVKLPADPNQQVAEILEGSFTDWWQRIVGDAVRRYYADLDAAAALAAAKGPSWGVRAVVSGLGGASWILEVCDGLDGRVEEEWQPWQQAK